MNIGEIAKYVQLVFPYIIKFEVTFFASVKNCENKFPNKYLQLLIKSTNWKQFIVKISEQIWIVTEI